MRAYHRFGVVAIGTALLAQGAPAGLTAQDSEQATADQIGALIEARQIDRAIDKAREAVGRYPQSSQLYQLYGTALFKKGANEDARTAFRRAVELDPSVPQNYYDLALVNLAENQYARAVPQLESYLRLDPENAQAHLLLGRAYHNLNRTVPAIEQFKKALALEPALPLAHYHLGYAYQSQGDLKAALEEFRKEIEINPNFCDSYWLAGNIELDEGDLDQAESLYVKASRLKPEAFQPHYGVGRVLAARKQFAAALAELKRAVELKPDDVQAHYALARTFQQMGDRESAEREFAISARLNAQKQSARSGIAGQRP